MYDDILRKHDIEHTLQRRGLKNRSQLFLFQDLVNPTNTIIAKIFKDFDNSEQNHNQNKSEIH
jgi:hypothetical protein